MFIFPEQIDLVVNLNIPDTCFQLSQINEKIICGSGSCYTIDLRIFKTADQFVQVQEFFFIFRRKLYIVYFI